MQFYGESTLGKEFAFACRGERILIPDLDKANRAKQSVDFFLNSSFPKSQKMVYITLINQHRDLLPL